MLKTVQEIMYSIDLFPLFVNNFLGFDLLFLICYNFFHVDIQLQIFFITNQSALSLSVGTESA